MAKVDPGLRFLAEQRESVLPTLADEAVFTFEAETGEEARVAVLLQFEGDLSAIEAAGFELDIVAGDVAVGEVGLSRVSELEQLDAVRRIEVSRVLDRDLDLAGPESRVDAVHTGPPGHRGTGVIIGIIDSGIDYTHQAFRRNDGTSRILAIWDQGLSPQPGESSPANFSFGVEYQKPTIDSALSSPNPLAIVRHQDQQTPGGGFHGTHVAGIAAGDGSVAGQSQPAFTFIGAAPEADIVVVANTRGRAAGERGLGDSRDTLSAVQYIFDLAGSLGRPAVINQSQGDNVGPHDGTSLLERGIDNLLGGPGRAMVKSAGNEGARNRHASGTITQGGAQTVRFMVPANQAAVTVDLWYRGPDRLDLSVTDPDGGAAGPFIPGTTTTPPVALPNGNELFVGSDLNDPENADNRIFVVISRGNANAVQQGTWSLALQGATVSRGQWDAWIQRYATAQFLPPFVNPARTISVPGTGREIITTGSYVTRGAGVGSVSSFSSLGPTRDGRQAPTVAAPGQTLMAPQPAATGDTYGLMQGTSMASPMVTGTVALLLQKNPNLTQAQIRDCLTQTARSDQFTGTTPNNAWGAGKLDANAAFGRVTVPVPTLVPPCPPPTVSPPCPPPTIPPRCPLPTLQPPCIPTIRPPCPPPTLRPPCPPPTVGPPCPPPTLAPGCPRPVPGPGGGSAPPPARGWGEGEGEVSTSGGWAPVEPSWGEDWTAWYYPYGLGWESYPAQGAQGAGPAEAWRHAGPPVAGGEQAAAGEWAQPLESGEAGAAGAAKQGDGVTIYWYGNPGY
jgi:subtilisin family serine protease